MLGSIISIMEGSKKALDIYQKVSSIIKGDQNKTAQYLKQMNDKLARMNLRFERLSDKILYAPTLQSVQDVTQPRQRYVDDLREIRASLEPVQQAVGDNILSSAMILTPDKMQKALAKSPWEVLMDIRPVNLAAQHDNADLVPVLFSHNGVQYLGWQMRGTLPMLFDCQFDQLWVPTQSQSQSSSRSSNDKPSVIVVAARGLRGDCQSISAAIKIAKPGSRILVKPGVYQESLIIDKPLQIVGEGEGEGEIVVESRESSCIWMKSEHALVRGLTLRCRAGSNNKYAVKIPLGQLTLQKCDITSNSLACVAIHGNKAEGIVSHCKIHDGKQSGIYVYDDGKGRIENCEICCNAYAGVAIQTGGNPVVQHCKIHNGKGGGVFVYDNGKGRIENCEILANAYAGILIKTGGNPVVRQCGIKRNGLQGVQVIEGGAGTIVNCELQGNRKGAWGIESGCEVRRRGNKGLF